MNYMHSSNYRKAGIVTFLLFYLLFGIGCSPSESNEEPLQLTSLYLLQNGSGGDNDKLSGGDLTVFTATSHAFSLPASNLTDEEEEEHTDGDTHFETAFVNHDDRDQPDQNGLGPIFNNNSCVGCHIRDGRGTPETGTDHRTMLFKISQLENGSGVNETTGAPNAIPYYGTQLGERALYGYEPEARVNISYTYETFSFPDGETYELQTPVYTFEDIYDETNWPSSENLLYSPRVAPPVFGRGLLEAIPDSQIEALADENDSDSNGISGKVQRVPNPETNEIEIGRFALKGENPTVRAQHAGAYLQDMGVTSSIFSTESCMEAGEQPQCAGDDIAEPEVGDEAFDLVVFYVQTLGVPARRNTSDSSVQKGKSLFASVGCASCHIPKFTTGDSDTIIRPLRNQTIYPYTDLLLHDMGDGLADGRPSFLATGSEWKTPALWGIGLTETVSGHMNLLHDGRARDLVEAIMWHGGEAAAVKQKFANLKGSERENLLQFLRSL